MGRKADLHKAIAAAAATQHGLISYKQLRQLGISKNGIRSRTDLGLLRRAGRGVYRLPSAPFTWQLRAVAALLANGPDSVLSHYAAAQLLGLDTRQRGRVDILIPKHRSGVAICSAKLHWTRGFGRGDVVGEGPFRFTSVARTLVDLAAIESPDRLVKTMDDAIVRQLCTPKQLAYLLDRQDSRTRKGTAALRSGLELWFGESTPQSVAEAHLVRAIVRAGIPAPICQFVVRDGESFTALLDLAWPEKHVAVEMDGYQHHGGARAFGRDMDRANRLAALGWYLLRTTPHKFARAPEEFFTNLRESLGLPCIPKGGVQASGVRRVRTRPGPDA